MKVLMQLLMAISLVASAQAQLSGHEIMAKHEEARKLLTVQAKAKLITGGGGTERVKDFTWWRKLSDNGVNYNTLTRFHFPPEVKGEGILFLEKSADKTDVQIYLPNFKKVRRVESQQQSGSFMGSEFSYSDIATPHVDDYKYKILEEEASCSEPSVTDQKCYVIEAIPATSAIKERTGTSKSVYWIRHDNYMAVKGEFYDTSGTLWKKMQATEIKEVDAGKKKWMAMNVRM
jgi:outer membrane lipoprotein-sorting protein